MAGNEPPVVQKRIFKVMFFTRDDPVTHGTIQKGDAIEHEKRIWLVPEWLVAIDEAWKAPLRLVCLSEPPIGANLQKTEGFDGAEYLLNFPIPIAAFRGEAPPKNKHGFLVIERPALKIARPN
jgi:hypothetical protein